MNGVLMPDLPPLDVKAILERHISSTSSDGDPPFCRRCGVETDHPCDAVQAARLIIKAREMASGIRHQKQCVEGVCGEA